MINAIKANDATALQMLYCNNYPKVESYILNNHGAREQVKDIYQEAFIAMWRNIQLNKFNPESDSALQGYLFRIAKNKWIDHLRSDARLNIVPLEDNGEESGDINGALNNDESEYVLMVRNNFKHLGERCRDLITKFYYNRQSLRQIAEFFNWTEATAKNNKYRCLQQLRELIKNTKS